MRLAVEFADTAALREESRLNVIRNDIQQVSRRVAVFAVLPYRRYIETHSKRLKYSSPVIMPAPSCLHIV
jgi:hypothetical protein